MVKIHFGLILTLFCLNLLPLQGQNLANVTDNNLKDSFNFLFKGFYLSTKNHDIKMAEILANMDLSLVDVLENSF